MQKSMLKKGTVLVIIILFIGAGIVSGLICNKEISINPITSDYKVGIKWNAGGVSSNEIATWFSGCILRVWDNFYLYKIDNTNWTEIEVYGDASIDYNHSSGIYFSGDSHTDASCRIVHSNYIPYDNYSIEMKPQFVSGWGGIGIIFNFQDADNFNEIYLTWNNICYITYLQHIDGEIDGYWRIETSFSAGIYDLKLEVNNTDGTCKIYLNEELKGIVDIRLPPDTVYVDDDFDENTTGWGYDHFDNIQDGIDAVNESGTVYVYNGTYYENVDITKNSIKIIGEDKNTTIIDGENMGGNIVGIDIINCYNVTVSKFTIRNFPAYGIQVNSKSNNYVNNMHLIKECLIQYNTGSGIALRCEGSNTHVKNCIILNCELHNNQFGFYFHNTRDGTNNYGNTITGCYIHDNNEFGIVIDGDGFIADNHIYFNNITDNPQNAKDEGADTWEYNYYSDYNGTDSDGNGIGDTPYNISGGNNKDNYPLMHPWGENPPVADFDYYYNTAQIIFDGSFSYDRDGEIVSYEWDFGDGTTGTGEIIVHKFCEIGTYNVTLTVTDDDGLKDNITKSAEIILANIPPSTPEINGPETGKSGEELEYIFDVTDPDGDDTYLWVDWDDGDSTGWVGALDSVDSVKLNHTWNESGTYTIKAKVKDFCAESEWVTLEVVIPRNRMTYNSLVLRFLGRFLDWFPMMRYLLRFMV